MLGARLCASPLWCLSPLSKDMPVKKCGSRAKRTILLTMPHFSFSKGGGTVGQSNRALWLLGFLPFYASGHILVVSIWIKSSIMTSFSEIGQLSLDFWTKNQFFWKFGTFCHTKSIFLTSNFKISSIFSGFCPIFLLFRMELVINHADVIV